MSWFNTKYFLALLAILFLEALSGLTGDDYDRETDDRTGGRHADPPIKQAGSAHKIADQIGVSPAYLSYIVNGHKIPSQTVCSFLGLRRVRVAEVYYERVK